MDPKISLFYSAERKSKEFEFKPLRLRLLNFQFRTMIHIAINADIEKRGCSAPENHQDVDKENSLRF
jgi:hypothetical protein